MNANFNNFAWYARSNADIERPWGRVHAADVLSSVTACGERLGNRWIVDLFPPDSRKVDCPRCLSKLKARRVSDNWEQTAIEWMENAQFYRNLLDEVAQHLGSDVFVADDGSVMDEPVRLKIPELVAAMAEREARMMSVLSAIREDLVCDKSLKIVDAVSVTL